MKHGRHGDSAALPGLGPRRASQTVTVTREAAAAAARCVVKSRGGVTAVTIVTRQHSRASLRRVSLRSASSLRKCDGSPSHWHGMQATEPQRGRCLCAHRQPEGHGVGHAGVAAAPPGPGPERGGSEPRAAGRVQVRRPAAAQRLQRTRRGGARVRMRWCAGMRSRKGGRPAADAAFRCRRRRAAPCGRERGRGSARRSTSKGVRSPPSFAC